MTALAVRVNGCDLAPKLDALAAALGAVREAHRDAMSAGAWRLLGEAHARIAEAMLAKPVGDEVDAAFADFCAAEDAVRRSGERWRAAVARRIAASAALFGGGSREGQIAVVRAAVAAFYGLTEDELRSKARPTRIAHPRQEAMMLARTLTHAPLEQVGDMFCRNHGTVASAVEAIAARIETSARYAAHFARVRALCEAALKGHE